MIEYINTQLNLWAQWLNTGEHHRLGYPKQSAFVRLVGSGPSARDPVMHDDAARIIDRAVAALPEDQYAVVDRIYISMRGCTGDEIARDLHCSRDTVYARLHRAHLAVMDALNMAVSEPLAAARKIA